MGSIIALPNSYTVVDLETTGLDCRLDDIIEIAALQVRDGVIANQFSSLISIGYEVPSFITELTGITTEMLDGAPQLDVVIQEFCNFLGEDCIIGHNVGFDIRFLQGVYMEHLERELTNPYVDTMRIARRTIPDLHHYRLSDVSEKLEIAYSGAHRAMQDCLITHECYAIMRNKILSSCSEDEFQLRCKKHNLKPSDIHVTTDEFNPEHPLFQKTVVFTGALSKMLRADAMQLVANCGGICGSGVTKTTNYLVVGTSDYISATEGKKTSKMQRAEKLQSEGYDIVTISEETFLDLADGANI